MRGNKLKNILYTTSGILIGLSVMMLTNAFTVETSMLNTAQYIKSTLLTSDGSSDTTKAVVSMNRYDGHPVRIHSGALDVDTICDSDGLNCKSVLNIPNFTFGTMDNGDLCSYNGTNIVCTTTPSEGGGDTNYYIYDGSYSPSANTLTLYGTGGGSNVTISLDNKINENYLNTDQLCSYNGNDIVCITPPGDSGVDNNNYLYSGFFDSNILSLLVSGSNSVEIPLEFVDYDYYVSSIDWEKSGKKITLNRSGMTAIDKILDGVLTDISISRGYIPYYNSSALTDSIIYNYLELEGGLDGQVGVSINRIGIGTTEPTEVLTLSGNLSFSPGTGRNITIAQRMTEGVGEDLTINAGVGSGTYRDGEVRTRKDYEDGTLYLNSHGGDVNIVGTASIASSLSIGGSVSVGSKLTADTVEVNEIKLNSDTNNCLVGDDGKIYYDGTNFYGCIGTTATCLSCGSTTPAQ